MTRSKGRVRARPLLVEAAARPTPPQEAARPLLLRKAYGPAAPDGPDNLLFAGDNLSLLQSLCTGPLRAFRQRAGGLKLVYLDPPFAVGTAFYTDSAMGPYKCLAYRDSWPGGLAGYLAMIRERLLLARLALDNDGCLFLHCDSRVSHHLRLMLDEIFGPERFLGEIIWHYTGGGRARRWFSRKHDSIFHYAVSDTWHFDPDAARVPYKAGSGYARSGITSAAGKRYLPHPDGTPVDDVWDMAMVNPLAAERTGYPTQKPLALLERILAVCSKPGDLTADFFCGSGTLALAAARLGRRWICADQSPLALQTTSLRLLEQGCRNFALAVPDQGQGFAANHAAARPPWREALPAFGPLRYALEPRLRLERRGDRLQVHLEGVQAHLAEPDRCADPPEPDRCALPPKAAKDTKAAKQDGDGPAAKGKSCPDLPGQGLDWLRAWGLSRPAGPEFATPWLGVDSLSRLSLWQTARCQKRGLALCSPKLPLNCGPLLLDLEDIFGNGVRQPWPVASLENIDE